MTATSVTAHGCVGLVRAAAKGIRKTTSRFGGRLEPFMYVDLQLAEGRSLDIITQVETLNPFARDVGSSYPAYTAGTAMLETAERLDHEEPVRVGRGSVDPDDVPGELAGRRVLHVQCHLGFDAITLARRGLSVVVLDSSGGQALQFLSGFGSTASAATGTSIMQPAASATHRARSPTPGWASTA